MAIEKSSKTLYRVVCDRCGAVFQDTTGRIVVADAPEGLVEEARHAGWSLKMDATCPVCSLAGPGGVQ